MLGWVCRADGVTERFSLEEPKWSEKYKFWCVSDFGVIYKTNFLPNPNTKRQIEIMTHGTEQGIK